MEMAFWEKVKKDVQKGVRDGFAVIREKAGLLTEEGKKRYRAFELKSQVHKLMADLGGLVYSLESQNKDPMADNKVKETITKIRKLEDQIAKTEAGITEKKAAPKRKKGTTRKKTSAKKKTAAKKKTSARKSSPAS